MSETFEEKREASRMHFAASAGQPSTETTPAEVTKKIAEFASTLSSNTPVWVPVIDDPYGLFGWCSDGVLEKMRHDGGSIRFGWTIWEWPGVLATAEFHAVWIDPADNLHDVTPKPAGEKTILFVPDTNYTPEFNFDNRPLNRRVRTFEPPDKAAKIKARIHAMTPSQLRYEAGRAERMGVSLEQRLLLKERADEFSPLVNQFIAICDRCDAKTDESMPGSGLFSPDRELVAMMLRRQQLLEKVRRFEAQIKEERS